MITKDQKITCILCPIGCKILIKIDGKKIDILEGNKCNKGIEYSRNEALDPRRMLTTLILVKNGEWPLVSVRTSEPVPKKKIFSVLKVTKNIKLFAPIKSGQIIIKNVANTNIDIIATKSIKKISSNM